MDKLALIGIERIAIGGGILLFSLISERSLSLGQGTELIGY